MDSYSKAGEFWATASEEHKTVAKKFNKGITVVHADSVTSRRMCPCLDYSSWCGFPLNGKAEYIEYRGEQI